LARPGRCPSGQALPITLRKTFKINNQGAFPPLSGNSAFDQTFGWFGALENAFGGGSVSIDLSLPDNRQFSAARSERLRAEAHAEHFAELVILVCNRPQELVLCGGAHGGTIDENSVQAKRGQDGNEQSIRVSE
jgi:hypothetical protein